MSGEAFWFVLGLAIGFGLFFSVACGVEIGNYKRSTTKSQ